MANITGTNNDDLDLTGTADDDNINGLDGNDVLNGGLGNDTLRGGKGFDTFVFDSQSGNDTIKDFTLAEDTIDLSAAGVTSIADLTISPGTGNSVVLSFGGNSITIQNLSEADVASINFIFAPSGPEFVQLGVDGTYTDAGDGTDQIIDGDNMGEELTDTDTFIFVGNNIDGSNSGDDVITDFQINALLPDFTIVPGDLLDLSAFGLFRTDLSSAGLTIEQFFAQGGITYSGTGIDADGNGDLDDSLLTFADGSTLTLLGVDAGNDIQVLIEANLTTPGGDPPGL